MLLVATPLHLAIFAFGSGEDSILVGGFGIEIGCGCCSDSGVFGTDSGDPRSSSPDKDRASARLLMSLPRPLSASPSSTTSISSSSGSSSKTLDPFVVVVVVAEIVGLSSMESSESSLGRGSGSAMTRGPSKMSLSKSILSSSILSFVSWLEEVSGATAADDVSSFGDFDWGVSAGFSSTVTVLLLLSWVLLLSVLVSCDTDMTRGAMLLIDADFSWATFDSNLSLELLEDFDFLL